MSIRFIRTTTRPSLDRDFGWFPNDLDLTAFHAYYSDLDQSPPPTIEDISADGLTMTLTTEFASIDEMLILTEEPSARSAIWASIHDEKVALGYIQTSQVIDTETGAEIANSVLIQRAAELRAEGKIPA